MAVAPVVSAGPDLVTVDGRSDGCAAVADQVADVLDADAVGGQDGHERVPELSWCPRPPSPAAVGRVGADYSRMAELVETYGDLPPRTTDASVIAVAERLKLRDVATLDRRHFTVIRPRHVNLLTLP